MYTANGIQHSERSPKNLRIAKLFAEREVKMELTEVVEYVFDTATDQNAPPFTLDDIQHEDDISCPYCGASSLQEIPLTSDMIEVEYYPEADPGEEYACPICGSVYGSQEEAASCCDGVTVFQCQNCSKMIHEDEYDAMISDSVGKQMEWWGVTDWLAKKLQALGETVITTPPIWGKIPSELQVHEEDAILEVCKEIGILEGQPHEWELA